MHSKFRLLLIALMTLSLFFPLGASFGSKVKASSNIATCDDLQAIDGDLTADYVVTNDIDTADCTDPFVPVGLDTPFQGTFDGGGHVIILHLNDLPGSNGLFANISGATVHDVAVTGTISGDRGTSGSLVGSADADSEIYEIASNVVINERSGDYVGGIVGLATSTVIHDVYFTGKIYADQFVGGIVGQLDGGTSAVTTSYSAGQIHANYGAGGIIGESDGIGGTRTIANDFSVSTITAAQGAAGLIGNFVSGDDSTNTHNYYDLNNVQENGPCANTESDGGFSPVSLMSCSSIDSNVWPVFFIGTDDGNPLLENWDTTDVWQTGSSYVTLRNVSLPDFHGPYYVNDCDELEMTANGSDPSAYYLLTSDIFLSSCTSPFEPVENFMGNFEGDGHLINFDSIVMQGVYNPSLFASANGEIDRLAVTGSLTVDGSSGPVGGVVASANNLILNQISSNLVITAPDTIYIGGLVGTASSVEIDNSYFVGKIIGDAFMGGILGWAANSVTISSSYSAGTINGNTAAGGLVGFTTSAVDLTNSFSESKLNANHEDGGLIGRVSDEIPNITNAIYNSALLPELDACYFHTNASIKVGGCDVIDGSDPDHFRNTSSVAPMADDNWDFVSTWATQSGQYPYLVGMHNFSTTPIDPVDVGGDGSSETPYLIDNCTELNNVRAHLDAAYQLTADLNCVDLTPIGSSSQSFTGTFDGNDHAITYSTLTTTDYAGLFASLDSATVENLEIDATLTTPHGANNFGGIAGESEYSLIHDITGTVYIDMGDGPENYTLGGIVGDSENDIYDNISIDVTIEADAAGEDTYISEVGGIAGSSQDLSFDNIDVSGTIDLTVSGTDNANIDDVGGFIGYDDGGTTINNSNSTIQIYLTNNSNGDTTAVGGIAGTLCDDDINCSVTNSSWSGEINILSATVGDVGGLVGEAYMQNNFFNGLVSNISTSGTISINAQNEVYRVGGVFGNTDRANIIYTSSNVDITIFSDDESVLVNQVGGIAGEATNTNITDSYYASDIEVHSYDTNEDSSVGGLVGEMGGSINRSYAQGTIFYGDSDNSQEQSGGVGGLVGTVDSDSTLNVRDSFAVVAITVDAQVDGVGALIGYAEDEPTLFNNYADPGVGSEENCVGSSLTDSEECSLVNLTGTEDDLFKENSTVAPLNHWNFTTIWSTVEASFPALREDPHTTDPEFAGGTGESDSPYQIATCAQLESIGSLPTGNFILSQDIDCTDFDFKPIGQVEGIVFRGVVDGDGHRIYGVNIDQPNTNNIGLFSVLSDANISNLNLEITLSGYTNVGGLTSTVDGQNTIDNVHSTTVITSCQQGCGGLIGQTYYDEDTYGEDFVTTVSNSSVLITLDTDPDHNNGGLGGLVGYGSHLNIYRSFAEGSINANGPSGWYVGGLVGELDNPELSDDYTVTESYADVDIEGIHTSIDLEEVGGLVGSFSSVKFVDSYAKGDIHISGVNISEDGSYISDIGGLVGDGNSSEFTNTYASGHIVLSSAYLASVGGLMGYSNYNITIENSFSAADLDLTYEENNNLAGFVGSVGDPDTFTLVNNYFDKELASGASCITDLDSEDCTAVNLENTTPNYFKGNNEVAPLNAWGFDEGPWKIVTADYPQLDYEDHTVSDTDHDGISDAIEDAGPNGGDANNDGVADSTQAFVTSFENPVSGHYTALETTDACTITASSISAESALASSDDAFSYPVGLMNFTLECDPGTTANISQYYYGYTPGDSTVVFRKYNANTHAYQTINDVEITTASIGGQQVLIAQYLVQDGGALDQDGLENGTIIDPSGPALNSVGVPNTGLGGSFRIS